MKAIGYIRVSTEDQAREGVSLENQRRKIQAYAELKNLNLVNVIEDAGISAKDLNRPGVQEVLRMAQSKEIDAVVVFKLDRMFRSTVDALETTKHFDKWGIAFHSINENLDTKSAMGKFFFTLTAAIAEMERQIVSERTKAALQHKRANGEKTGGDVPFGYQADNGTLTPDRQEQRIIRLMKKLKDAGHSLREIGSELRKRGYKSKTGKDTWNPKTIANILKRAA